MNKGTIEAFRNVFQMMPCFSCRNVFRITMDLMLFPRGFCKLSIRTKDDEARVTSEPGGWVGFTLPPPQFLQNFGKILFSPQILAILCLQPPSFFSEHPNFEIHSNVPEPHRQKSPSQPLCTCRRVQLHGSQSPIRLLSLSLSYKKFYFF